MAGLDAGTAYVTILPQVGAQFASILTRSISAPVKAEGEKASKALASAFTLGRTAAIGAFAAIAGAAIKGLGAAAKSTLAFAMDVRAMSRQLGLSAQDASRLIIAGEHVGITSREMAVAFGVLEKQLINNGAATKQYGVTLTDAQGNTKGFLTVLGELADKYVALGGGIKGAALAQNVFGRSGKLMIPLLREGSAGLAEFLALADKYGNVLTGKDLQATLDFVHAQRDLHEATQGLAISIGREVIPILTALEHVLISAVQLFGAIPGPVKFAIIAVGGLAAAFVALGLVLNTVRKAMIGWGITLPKVATEEAALAAETDALTVAMTGAGAAGKGILGGLLVGLARGFALLGPEIAAATVAYLAFQNDTDFGAQGRAQAAVAGIDSFSAAIKQFGLESAQGQFAAKRLVGTWMTGVVPSARIAGEAYAAFVRQVRAGDPAALDMAHRLELLERAHLGLLLSTNQVAGATRVEAEAFQMATDAALANRAANEALAGGLLGVESAILGARSAHLSLAQAQAAVNKDIKDGHKGTAQYRQDILNLAQAQNTSLQAQLSIRTAVTSYAQTLLGPAHDAYVQYQKDLADSKVSDQQRNTDLIAWRHALDAAAPAQQKAIAMIRDMGAKAGLTKAQVNTLIQQVLSYTGAVKGVPRTSSTTFTTPGLAQANAGVQNLAHGIQAVQGPHDVLFIIKTIGHVPPVKVQGRGSVFRAAGGTLFMGPGSVGPFVAGEAAYPTPLGTGAELVSNRGVLPLDDAVIAKLGRAIAAAGGSSRSGPTTVVVKLDRREIGRAIVLDNLWAR